MLIAASEVQPADRAFVHGLMGRPLLVEHVTGDDEGVTLTLWMDAPNEGHMVEVTLDPEIPVLVERQA